MLPNGLRYDGKRENEVGATEVIPGLQAGSGLKRSFPALVDTRIWVIPADLASGLTTKPNPKPESKPCGSTVSLLYEDARGEATLNAPIARRTEFWWSERQREPI